MKDILENTIYCSDLNRILEKYDFRIFDNKTILVTGGLGLICSSVIDLLYVSKLRIRLLVADINETYFYSRYGKYKNIEFIKYDAREDLNFNFKVDYIIHGAGLASPELYISNPVETMTSNIVGVYNLLKYAKEIEAKRVLYISSSEVYGYKNDDSSFVEDIFGTLNINDIRSSYSESKRASEVLCRSFTSEYNLETVIVRPGHIYGPTASPKDKRVSSFFAYKAAKGENIEMKSSGQQKRSYCYSLDCAAAILLVLANGNPGESYNIGHNEITSIRKMSEIISEAGNVKLKTVEPKSEEVSMFNPMINSSLDIDKIKNIGYSDTFSVKEGLTHTVEILRYLYGY